MKQNSEPPSALPQRNPDAESDLVECPACAGEGQVFPGVKENLWDGRLRWPDVLQAQTCELCQGTGEVDPGTAAKWDASE